LILLEELPYISDTLLGGIRNSGNKFLAQALFVIKKQVPSFSFKNDKKTDKIYRPPTKQREIEKVFSELITHCSFFRGNLPV
jgi:hypothetical protein